MQGPSTQPIYVKLSHLLICGFGIVFIFYIGQEIFIPLMYSALFAVLLAPVVHFLTQKGMNRIVAITLALLVSMLLIVGLIYFVGTQVAMLTDSIPQLKVKFGEIINELRSWLANNTGIDQKQIDEYLNKGKSDLSSEGGALVGSTLLTITGVLTVIVLIPIYVFMFLYYEPLFTEFIKRVFPEEKHVAVCDIVVESKSAMQNYLGGLLIETGIIAVLNSVGLLIIGVDYAILWGILGGFLNIIPYIGGIIAVALPMLMALITQDATAVFMVLALYTVVQFIDNNFIVPAIVASRVKINALASIVIVLIGGALWGVSGMFLSIPILGIFKIVFDRITPLKPYGFILGDHMPEYDTNFFNMNRIKKLLKNRSAKP
jgi:predicted PurR-regulated permease PerM